MVRRVTPSSGDLVDALHSHGINSRTAHPGRLTDDTAIEWSLAIDIIRAAFRTTRAKADEWLVGEITRPGSKLIGVWNAGTVKVIDGPRIGKGTKLTANPADWEMDDHVAFQFTQDGVRIPIGAKHSEMKPYVTKLPWIMYRDALPLMHKKMLAERAEKDREQTERKDAELTVFRSVHGGALDTIQRFVDRIDQSDVDHRFRDYPKVRTSARAFGNGSEFGAPGSLEITLYGKQIEAFAALIRETTGAE